jgi:hypothetical protein
MHTSTRFSNAHAREIHVALVCSMGHLFCCYWATSNIRSIQSIELASSPRPEHEPLSIAPLDQKTVLVSPGRINHFHDFAFSSIFGT